MTDTIFEQPTDQRRNQRLQAFLVLVLGFIIAALAIYLAVQNSNETAAAPETLVQEQGIFPVASLFGIDNSGAQPDVGHAAPNFAFHLPDGATVTLADYRGQPVLVNFWATWCGPCRQEMPDIVRAYEAHKDEGLVVLEVNSAEAHEPVAAFVDAFNMSMPVVIDARREVMGAYKTQSLPSSFFIDKDGVIQTRWIGFMTRDVLEAQLAKIL